MRRCRRHVSGTQARRRTAAVMSSHAVLQSLQELQAQTPAIAGGPTMSWANVTHGYLLHPRCYTHVCTHVCTHAYTHVYTHDYIHVCTHAYAHVYAHVYTHVSTHAYTHVGMHVYTHVCTHVYAHVYTHVYTSARTNGRRGVWSDGVWWPTGFPNFRHTCLYTCLNTSLNMSMHMSELMSKHTCVGMCGWMRIGLAKPQGAARTRPSAACTCVDERRGLVHRTKPGKPLKYL